MNDLIDAIRDDADMIECALRDISRGDSGISVGALLSIAAGLQVRVKALASERGWEAGKIEAVRHIGQVNV